MAEPYTKVPKAFISYSWDDDAHREWVARFATQLMSDGVAVTLDRWHAAPGDQIPAFMERAVRENDFVIAVCTPRFKEKSDGRAGGVGYEGDIMTAYAFTGAAGKKFIPVLRGGSLEEVAPTWLLGRFSIDLNGEPFSELQYELLLRTLHGARELAPELGHFPKFEEERGLRATPNPAMADPHRGSATPGGLPERITRIATGHLVVLASYLAALAGLILGFLWLDQSLKSLYDGHTWVLLVVAALPLVLAIAFMAVPSMMKLVRQNRLRDKGIRGVLSRPGYFRITPYEDDPDDQKAYARADGAHLEVEGWLERTDESFLYLTGLSGAGKSSLLNAYVLPRLRANPGRVRPVVVPRHDSLHSLRRELLSPGVIWKKPPADDGCELPGLVLKACDYLRQARLILVFDQFEELLILHERDKGRIDELRGLIEALREGHIRNLTFLFVFRSDYQALIHRLTRRLDLPSLRQDDNWKVIGPFTEGQARDFLLQSGLTIGDGLMDEVFGQIAEVEEAEGLVRPITLNMMGLVLARSALASVRALPRHREAAGLLFGYLRESIRHPHVRDHARPILQAMITPAGTKSPKPVGELVSKSGFSEEVVVGCLLELVEPGLVRRLDERENVWEISHDFVARLLAQVLSTWRTGLLRRARAWAVPAGLGVWAVVFLIVPAATPWYKRIPVAEIRRLDSNGQSNLHRAALEGDKDEAALAVAHFLEKAADPGFVNIKDRDGLTSLHVASSNGHIRVMEALLAGKADPNLKDKLGETPLHKATYNGDVEAMRALLDARAEIEAKNSELYTSLCIASIRGHEEALKFLLERGASVETRDAKGQTVLHLAAIHGNAGVAGLLAARKADLRESKDGSGRTPLHETAIEGKPDVAMVLLDAGASIEALDGFRNTPLISAAMNNRAEVARLLLDRKANPEAKEVNGHTALHWASHNGHLETIQAMFRKPSKPSIDATDLGGATALHAASGAGHGPVVSCLIELGASIEATDKALNTPLISAAANNQAEVARLLLDRKANPEAKEVNGHTALHWASNNGHLETIQAMFQKAPKPSIDATNSVGATALHVASGAGHGPVVSCLTELGANLEATDKALNTPLLSAVWADRAEAARLLLDRKANPEAKEINGNTALHAAAYSGFAATVRALLKDVPRPAIDSRNAAKLTALHAAAINGHGPAVLVLLELGADLEARDDNGFTPLLWAVVYKRSDVARLLLDHGANPEAKDKAANTPLVLASNLGDREAVDALIGHKVAVDARNPLGFTALHTASLGGQAPVVELLLNHGASANATSSNFYRPLHSALSGTGDAQVVRLLLDHGAEINPRTDTGETPLHLAVMQRRYDAIKLLMDRHADPSLKNNAGASPLDLARTMDDKQTLALLEKP